MLSLTCNVLRRARPEYGGIRYDLQPFSYQMIDQHRGVLSIDLSHISIFDFEASKRILSLYDRPHPPKDSSSSINLGSLGHLHCSVFLSEDEHTRSLDDLNQALAFRHLKPQIHFGEEFQRSDQGAILQWLTGERFADNYLAWSNSAALIDLAVVHP